MTYKNVNVTRSEFVCSCLIFVFLVCVCLHTLYIYYITIIYTCMSWGQNLSAHDDFMIANHAWTLCLFTHIYRPWGQICLLMFIFVLLIWLFVYIHVHLLIMLMRFHDEPVTAYFAWTCVFVYRCTFIRSWGQHLSAHVYVIICMCFAEFSLVCYSFIRFY